jgi:pantetheine-phosphate adenylyltransferase
MKSKAIYPGTFDPITYGHVDLVERAARIFDQVIVAIAGSQNKKPLFTLPERVDLCTQALGHFPNVNILGFDSLLLEFAQHHGANVILRGLRTVTDFDYEFQLAGMNRILNPAIESMFLMPAERYMYISSSLVREVALLGGDVAGFVPSIVVRALQKKVPGGERCP